VIRPEAMDCRHRRAMRIALVLWSCALLVMLIRAGLRPDKNNCFVDHYRPAGLNWFAGAELYQTQADTCRYSPLMHALLVPFSLPGERLGTLLWRVVSYLALFGALLWWLRAACPTALTGSQRAALLLLALPLSIGSLNNGQANVLMLAGILAGMAALSTRRWNVAAVVLALACFLKMYPIALVLLVMVIYPQQFAPRFVFVFAVGMLLPFALHEPSYVARQYGHWLDNLRGDDRSEWDLSEAYRDAWLLVRIMGLPLDITAYRVVQVVAGGMIGLFCWTMKQRGEDDSTLLSRALAMGCCWMTAFGPATESPTYILLSAPLALLLIEAHGGTLPNWSRGPLLLAVVLLLLTVIAVALPIRRDVLAMGPQPLAALLVLATVGVLCFNAPIRCRANSHSAFALPVIREKAA
jgi:Glycosyltransferase family 87